MTSVWSYFTKIAQKLIILNYIFTLERLHCKIKIIEQYNIFIMLVLVPVINNDYLKNREKKN